MLFGGRKAAEVLGQGFGSEGRYIFDAAARGPERDKGCGGQRGHATFCLPTGVLDYAVAGDEKIEFQPIETNRVIGFGAHVPPVGFTRMARMMKMVHDDVAVFHLPNRVPPDTNLLMNTVWLAFHCYGAWRPLGRAIVVAALFAMVTFLANPAHSQFYWSEGFQPTDASQTNLRKLVYGELEQEKKEARRNDTNELAEMERQKSVMAGDAKFLQGYAVLSFLQARDAQAEAAWQELLRRDPGDVATLLNLSTARMMRGRPTEGEQFLQRALALRPNIRAGAEQVRLRMLEFNKLVAGDGEFGRNHVMLDEMSAAWLGRGEPPDAFPKGELTTHSLEAVGGFVHAFPHYADGWFTLGMMLEHDRQWDLARQAYQRALKLGSTQSLPLKKHFEKIRELNQSRNPALIAGRTMVRVIVLVLVLIVLRYVSKLVAAMLRDRAEVKQRRQNEIDKELRRMRAKEWDRLKRGDDDGE